MSNQSHKAGRRPRPSEIVSKELGAGDGSGPLERHLVGCLAGYNQNPNFGSAVHFGLEAIWGIGVHYQHLAAEGKIPETDRDAEIWLKSDRIVGVPWLWVLALTRAWDRYDKQGEPFERAFGLGGARGKRPTRSIVNRMLDERAVAVDVWNRVQKSRATGRKLSVIDALHAAAEKFSMSFDAVHRIWKKQGRKVRLLRPRG